LGDEFWQGTLRANPTRATSLGDTRYDDRLEDIGPAGIAAETKRLEGVLAKAQAIDERALAPGERLTRTALITEVEGNLAFRSCGFEEWTVDPLGGPQAEFMNLADYTTIEIQADAAKYVKRVQAMGPYLDQHIANLRRGKALGLVAPRDAVQKTVDQIERILGSKDEELGVWKPVAADRPTWSRPDRDKFAKDLRAVIKTSLRPGLARYRSFLAKEILPVARSQGHAGLSALPHGIECYQRLIRAHTSLELTPQEVHQLGLAQVAQFRRDLAVLGERVFGTSDVAEIQRRLRTDPAMHFKTSEEVETKARETLARAEAAVPKWFGLQPKAPCDVKVMGMHEAPYSTIAYYREPSAAGKRPGTYMINTYLPETRPRYEAEALAFHEAVPGHHLQIAIANELTGIPEFRKHIGVTAFVEGWALYTERLADEAGLYTSDVDRLGMLSFDAWRACRLVVDTGIHAMGWSRQQAIDYMTENSVLAENNIVNEVDRYITWPGQALAYKIGQREILGLRDEAKQRLGDRFDIKAFHDAVLSNGAVSLPMLREQVRDYIARAEGARPAP
jgi:uncharacterized protein (DUF885 family)